MAQSIRDKSEDRTRTHHSLPQDQALRGASVDLQLDGLWRVMGTKTHKKNPNYFTPDALLYRNNTPSVRVKQSRKANYSYLLGKIDFGRAMYPSLWK